MQPDPSTNPTPEATESTVDPETVFKALAVEVGKLTPTALDMVATMVDAPQGDLESWDNILTIVEANPPQLFLALLRVAAGLAHVCGMSGDDVRALDSAMTANAGQ